MSDPAFPLIVQGLRDLAGMELAGLELRPELPRAVPITMKHGDGYCLVGLRFANEEDAAQFAKGVAGFGELDGVRFILKRHLAVNRDEGGNVSGIN